MDEETQERAAMSLYDKCQYSIMIRNLADSWARTCPVVNKMLLERTQSHTTVPLRSPSAFETYATKAKRIGRPITMHSSQSTVDKTGARLYDAYYKWTWMA